MNKQSIHRDQSGFASILVTMIIMVVLVLITVGFVRIIGREQRQSLDRQLSTQAFYAAETGINDAVAAITNSDPAVRYTVDKTQCEPDGSAAFPAGSNQVDTNISYTCLLIDQAPTTLEYSSINQTNPIVIPINSQSGVAIDRLRISWQAESPPSNTFPASVPADAFPANWTHAAGVLRTSLTPIPPAAPGALSRQNLISNTYTSFLYPVATGVNAPPTPSIYPANPAFGPGQGPIISGSCNTGNNGTGDFFRFCNADITGLSLANYMLVLRSIYSNSSVTVAAYDSSGTRLRLANAQSLVDATGRAGDVLRRMQVRVPSRDDYAYPGFSLETGSSICKRYSLAPSSVNPDGSTSNASGTDDPACAIP